MRRILGSILFVLVLAAGAGAATYVNDGNINWNGNWHATGQVKTLHSSTTLRVDNGQTRYSVAWNGNASNTDRGVLVYPHFFDGTSNRTITAELQRDVGGGSWQTEVSGTYAWTNNSLCFTWIYIEFSAAHTETNGTANYRIALSGSSVDDVAFRVDSAATSNIGFIQVLNATGTLGAGDSVHIVGASTQTGGNPDTATVTLNGDYSATTYGTITVSNGGVLACGNQAATIYYLKFDGNLDVYQGGTFNCVGTNATKSTLECAASAQRTITISDQSSVTVTGAAKTGNLWRTTLSNSETAGSGVTLELANDPQAAGWAVGEYVTISPTEAATQTELVQITAVGAGTITATIANDHAAGAEVCLQTRNVVWTESGSSTARIIISAYSAGCSIDFDWVEFSNWASPSAGTQGGIAGPSVNSSASITFDYCSFNTMGTGSYTSQDLYLTYPITRIADCLFYNSAGNYSIYGTTPLEGLLRCSFATTSKSSQNALYLTGSNALTRNADATYVKDTNIYGSSTTGRIGINLMGNPACIFLDNVKVWFCNSGATTSGFAGTAKLVNCVFGGDGTNTYANSSIDWGFNPSAYVTAYNTKFLSATEMGSTGGFTTDKPWLYNGFFASHNHDATPYRYKTWKANGLISDPTSAGLSGTYAKGGTGTCVVLAPNATGAGYTLNWEFSVPVTASTSTTVSFYITKTTADFDGAVNVDVYDSDDDNTLLVNNASVAVASIPTNDGVDNDWTYQYTSSSFTPTDTGFCRVVVKVLDGATAGGILIDDVSVSP